MSKLAISKNYKKILTEKNKETPEKTEKKLDKEVKNPKDKIIAGLKGMKPGATMQTVAKQLDISSPHFLGKYLIQILVNAAKNGKVKFDALKDSLKDFSKKNIEDNSNIDWEHVELDPSSTTMKCLFDGDSKKIIDEFMKQYESEMKDIQSEIEEADKKLHDDVKKAKIQIDDDTLDENGIAVASVIDDKKNKKKSGKALTKKVKAAIKQKKEVDTIKKRVVKASKKLNRIKVDSRISKISDDDLSKELKEADKKLKNKKTKSQKKDINSLVKKLDKNITKKIGKDYKSSLLTGIYDKEELKKYASKNNVKINFSSIKSKKVIGIRIDFFGDESSKVILEVVDDKAGYKTRKISANEKNKSIKKIYTTFTDIVKSTFDKDMLNGDFISYLKYWNGKNDDGNFDSLFILIGVKTSKNKKINESLIVESHDKYFLPIKTLEKISEWWNDHWYEANPEAAELHKQILKNSAEVFGKSTFGIFDYQNSSMPHDQFQKLVDQYKELERISTIRFDSQEYTSAITVKGIKHARKLAGYSGNDAFYKAIDYAKKHTEVAGNISKIQEDYIGNISEKSLEKTGTTLKSAAQVAKSTGEKVASTGEKVASTAANSDIADNTTEKIGFAVMPNGEKIPSFSYITMTQQIESLDDIFDDGKIDENEMKKLKDMGSRLNAYLEWAEQNKGSKDESVQFKIIAIKRLNQKYITLLDNNPVGYTTDGSGRILNIEDIGDDPKQAKAAAVAASSDEAKKTAVGWKEKLGLDKAFTAIGIARLMAKTTGVILNNGKSLVDMAGKQAVKYKEDNDIIAELKCILTNGEGSNSKFEDTKFSVRFDLSDCKWHATCLDNRKMKFPEDKLLKAVFDSEQGKKFKEYCLNRWSSIFAPKDQRKAIIPFIFKNAEQIGMKNVKMPKDFIETIKMMSDKFDKIEAAMK